MSGLKWGGYVHVLLVEKTIKELNKKLADEKTDWHLAICLQEILDRNMTIKIGKYNGAPQVSALTTEDSGDGKQYGVSAYGHTLEIAAYVLVKKLEQVNWGLSGETKTDNSGELPAFG